MRICPNCGYFVLSENQHKIIEILKTNKKGLSISEIFRKLNGLSYKNTHTSIQKLIQLGLTKGYKKKLCSGQPIIIELKQKKR